MSAWATRAETSCRPSSLTRVRAGSGCAAAESNWKRNRPTNRLPTRRIWPGGLPGRPSTDESWPGASLHGIEPGELTLGSDNGSAFTTRRFRATLAELGIRHRRGGYRDPESQAFIESWFGKLKEREVWLNEYETLDDARRGIGGYVDRYHHRPHSGLNYKTPYEVKETWEDLQNIAA